MQGVLIKYKITCCLFLTMIKYFCILLLYHLGTAFAQNCPDVAIAIVNGKVGPASSTAAGSIRFIKCNSGHELVIDPDGSPFVVCQTDGTWKLSAYCVWPEQTSIVADGEKCLKDSDCQNSRVCRIQSMTCGHGLCMCPEGSIEDTSSLECKQTVNFGGFCNDDKICSTDYSYCLFGVCSCIPTYERRSNGVEAMCVVQTKKIGYLGNCYDSIQCLNNMQCIVNQCNCQRGEIAIHNVCKKIRIGDFCSSNIDCVANANSYCFNGKCSCAPGFKQVTTWLEASEPSLVCIEKSENLLLLGEKCNSTTVSFGNRHCQPPLVCHQCATDSHMCVDLTQNIGIFGVNTVGCIVPRRSNGNLYSEQTLNMVEVGKKMSIGSKVKLQCNVGYSPDRPDIVSICQPGGFWLPSPEICFSN